jgi:hypothetical protein
MKEFYRLRAYSDVLSSEVTWVDVHPVPPLLRLRIPLACRVKVGCIVLKNYMLCNFIEVQANKKGVDFSTPRAVIV